MPLLNFLRAWRELAGADRCEKLVRLLRKSDSEKERGLTELRTIIDWHAALRTHCEGCGKCSLARR